MQENDNEDLDLESKDAEEFAESIDDDELRAPLLTEIARKKHFREKFQKEQEVTKKLEAELAEFKDADKVEAQEVKADASDELRSNVSTLMQAEDKRGFGYANGLSPEETDEVFAYATGKGISPADAKESPIMKAALESMREQRRADEATPGASRRAPLFNGKTFSDVVTDEKTSDADKQKAFETLVNRTGVNSNE